MSRRSVLLIGATGAFGCRLARRLAQIPGIALVVTSRHMDRASALARTLDPLLATGTQVTPAIYAHGPEARRVLRDIAPFLVIDASGPFQSANYETARAAIETGAHWIDLADAPAYVLGFNAALDRIARARGMIALTGASSTPSLSHAVVAELTRGWQRVDDIGIAIYPAGTGTVGRAVIEGVLSYTGAPVMQRRQGRVTAVPGWLETARVNVDGLGSRLRAPVATADYQTLSDAFGAPNIAFYAGLASRIEQFGLKALASMKYRGIIDDLERFAPLLLRARRMTGLSASPDGAMTVEVAGIDRCGQPARSIWTLLARHGDGPSVPILPALAAARRLLLDCSPVWPAGARTALRELPLAAIEAEMAPHAITTDILTGRDERRRAVARAA